MINNIFLKFIGYLNLMKNTEQINQKIPQQ